MVKWCLVECRHLIGQRSPPSSSTPALPTIKLHKWLVVLLLHNLFQHIPDTNTNVVQNDTCRAPVHKAEQKDTRLLRL